MLRTIFGKEGKNMFQLFIASMRRIQAMLIFDPICLSVNVRQLHWKMIGHECLILCIHLKIRKCVQNSKPLQSKKSYSDRPFWTPFVCIYNYLYALSEHLEFLLTTYITYLCQFILFSFSSRASRLMYLP